jgi:cold shock CspA family protein
VSNLRISGRVASFDEARGDGVVVTELGESLYFHCVQIADGTRNISVGAEVSGLRAVGRLGSDELIDLQKL